MKTQKKGRRLPKIDHRRDELKPSPELGIAKIIMEVRGVRSTSRLVLDDGTVTRVLFNISEGVEDTPEDDIASLFKAANKLLIEAEELAYFDILKGKQTEEITAQKLNQWVSDLALRHGFLSPLTLAGEYLIAKIALARALDSGIKNAWPAIVEFCQAHHWLRFELSGLHSMAAGSARDSQALAVGPMVKAERAAAAKEIVSHAYQAFCLLERRDTHRNNATYVAPMILEAVNQTLIASDLPRFTEGSLRKSLGKIIRRD